MLLGLAPAAFGEGPTFLTNPDPGQPRDVPDAFYCQPPVWMTLNASTGFNTEVADDIPSELAGQTIGVITLYVAEWSALWIDPTGIIIYFYADLCPPPMEPLFSFQFPWADLSPELIDNPTSPTIYEVHATLPEPVVITEAMSLGTTVNNNWGEALPSCGVCFTEPDVVYGCDELFWDAAAWGYPRWTRFSDAVGIYANLAYCLTAATTSVPDGDPRQEARRITTWGALKSLYR